MNIIQAPWYAFLKLINNSKAKDKGNHALWRVWISGEKLLVFASLISPSKSVCLGSYIKYSSQCFITIYKKPQSLSKILRYASYFWLSSLCLICDETQCLVFDILHLRESQLKIIIIIMINNILLLFTNKDFRNLLWLLLPAQGGGGWYLLPYRVGVCGAKAYGLIWPILVWKWV